MIDPVFPIGAPNRDVPDPGDKYDVLKSPKCAWDFPESSVPVKFVKGHRYRAKTAANLETLVKLRSDVENLCHDIMENNKEWIKDDFFIGRVAIFLDIHFGPWSKWTLNEIPEKTGFDGMNKPRDRYIVVGGPEIGADGLLRAGYREIFLNMKKSKKDLVDLLIHELAHTMANHVTFREDDHHQDFKKCEKFIKKYWPKT